MLQVTKQLFEPLLMQLIHWFTKNNKAESEESMALLDSIYVSYWWAAKYA